MLDVRRRVELAKRERRVWHRGDQRNRCAAIITRDVVPFSTLRRSISPLLSLSLFFSISISILPSSSFFLSSVSLDTEGGNGSLTFGSSLPVSRYTKNTRRDA